MQPKSALKDLLDDLLGRKQYRRYGEKEQRKSRLLSQLFALLGIIAGGLYLVICIYFANWNVWYAFVPFIIADSGFFVLYMLTTSNLWLKRYHNPEGLDPYTELSVDVFIPVCREPLSIVEETIAAAVALDYKRKLVHILDDGEDDNLKLLAEKYNVNYFRRPEHFDTKAGNLNYAFQRTSGDLILALDSDQVARPELIKKIIGYFKIPRIAFVQTPQSFKLPKNDPWGNADTVFYNAIQAGKDYDNSAISCGSGVMYRRKALQEIGGFSTWNLVEDLHTSMRLHDKGWHSVYHKVPMTKGTAPSESISQAKQRWHWAVDSMRILFWDCPLNHRGLKFAQRLQYFHFGYYYITIGIFLPISIFVIPQWALFSHKFILTTPPLVYLFARLPYLLIETIANKLLSEKSVSFKTNQAQVSMFAVYFHAIFVALFHRNSVPSYTVTRKQAVKDPFLQRAWTCLPHIVVIAFSISAIIYGLVTIENDFWFLFVNIFFALFPILYLWKFIVLSLWPRLLVK